MQNDARQAQTIVTFQETKMTLTLSWTEIGLRLALSFVAGGLIGLNRTEHGRPAGLRTNILVSLAACVAMLQANLLMPTTGKTSDSFVVLDLMRLPLGILSGMGFIGGGAILRKDSLVLGVTTAATLWFVTVIGLCFGGGQLGLGSTATVLAILVLWLLRWLEQWMPRDHQGTLTVTTTGDALSEEDIRAALQLADCKISAAARVYAAETKLNEMRLEVRWRAPKEETLTPAFFELLARREGVQRVDWRT